jgi:hypothetical protein
MYTRAVAWRITCAHDGDTVHLRHYSACILLKEYCIAATGLRAGQPKYPGSISGRTLSSSHIHSIKTGFGAYPYYYPLETGTLYSGVKRSRLTAGHSPPASADSKCVDWRLCFPEKFSCRGSSLSKKKIIVIYLINISQLQNVIYTLEINVLLDMRTCILCLMHSSHIVLF